MGLLVLVLYLLGIGLLAYGLGLIYAPLTPIVIAFSLLAIAYTAGSTFLPGRLK